MSVTRVSVVAGDVMLDQNLAVRGNPGMAERSWAAAGRVHLSRYDGGAALMAKLVEKLAARHGAGPAAWSVRRVDHMAVGARVGQTHTLLARDADGKWRIEKFLGVEPSPTKTPNAIVGDTADADVVLLLDADMGFRDLPAEWPLAITTDGKQPWVILKTCAHDFEGPLWERLLDHHASRLIVVTSIDDLRRRDIQISKRLSWERTAEDLVWEMRRNPAINVLSRSQHSIVSFGPAGAVLLSRTPEEARLLFDPSVMEGEWEPRDRGGTIGYTVTLAAAVADELMRAANAPNPSNAIRSGMAGMRALNDSGYGDDVASLAFPIDAIAAAVASPPAKWSEEKIPIPSEPRWSILRSRLGSSGGDADERLYELASQVALHGPAMVLNTIPQARFGELFTADRQEIESLRSIQGLVAEYMTQRPSKPISIAVFGPPGSGKSFGVKQVALSLQTSEIEVRMLTFNVSQFAGPEDLHGAFHQVRDVSLSGKMPIVFWDEFDTPYNGQLGWLRYFLAPMQDGEFQDRQITHPIGTSIFVFAGGTAHELSKFGTDMNEDKRKAAKLPDFLSRLKGFLNVLGPDPRGTAGTSSAKATVPRDDPHFVIRRAILLRSIMERNAKSLIDDKEKTLQIDPGLLRALLLTKTYKHGARSMEAVIAMSALTGKTKFERSSLPSEAQFDLHVDSADFMGRMQEVQLTDDIVEKLAEKAHALSLITDALGPYASLPEGEKDSLRAFVRSIPQKLAKMNYVMTPVHLDSAAASLSRDDIAMLAPIGSELWRDLAERVPPLLELAGYRIVKLSDGKS
jgi:hypothetical protein